MYVNCICIRCRQYLMQTLEYVFIPIHVYSRGILSEAVELNVFRLEDLKKKKRAEEETWKKRENQRKKGREGKSGVSYQISRVCSATLDRHHDCEFTMTS